MLLGCRRRGGGQGCGYRLISYCGVTSSRYKLRGRLAGGAGRRRASYKGKLELAPSRRGWWCCWAIDSDWMQGDGYGRAGPGSNGA